MTASEVQSWLEVIGDCTSVRIRVIKDLILHANSDEMSEEDRAICVSTLRTLEALPPDSAPHLRPKRLIVRQSDDEDDSEPVRMNSLIV